MKSFAGSANYPQELAYQSRGVPVDLIDPGKAPAEAAKQLPRALRLKGIKKGVQWDSPPPDCGPPQISSVRPSARCGIVP